MNKFLAFLIAALLIFSVMSTVQAATGDLDFAGGVIRNTGSGWFIMNNSGHQSIGLSGISQTTTKITVYFSKVYSKVNTCIVTVDDTMASQGYTVGASVGLDKVNIMIFDSDLNVVNPASYTDSGGNIWISGHFIE